MTDTNRADTDTSNASTSDGDNDSVESPSQTVWSPTPASPRRRHPGRLRRRPVIFPPWGRDYEASLSPLSGGFGGAQPTHRCPQADICQPPRRGRNRALCRWLNLLGLGQCALNDDLTNIKRTGQGRGRGPRGGASRIGSHRRARI